MSKYVVIDLEMCSASGKKRLKQKYSGCEVIQIGAVLLDESYQEIDSFKTYVQPEFGVLSNRIQNLTGIKPEHLKDAPLFEDALELFCNWVGEQDVIIIAWSENDEKQLRREMEKKGIENQRIQNMFVDWTDCQVTFAKKMQVERCYNLQEALIASDIFFQDGAHDALVDAHNTGLLFAKMEQEEVFSLNQYYLEARNEECNHLQFGFGELFQNFQLVS